MRLLTWIVKFYPRAWRTRYETEMLTLLEEHHITFLTVLDLLFGALDARLDPYYRTEKALFAFKSLHTAVMAFIAAIALATFCMFFWQMQVEPLASGIGLDSISTSVAGYSYGYVLYLAIFACNIPIALVAVKRAVAARRVRTILFAAVCFALPVVVLVQLIQLLIASSFAYYGLFPLNVFPLLWYVFISFAGLELVMGNLLLTIIKGKEAITTRNIRPLLLAAFVDLLLVLLGFGLYFYHAMSSVTDVMNLGSGLFPLAGAGTLLLMMTNSKINKQILHVALIAGSMIILTIIVNLLASISWELTSWVRMVQTLEPWFIFNGQFPLLATAGLAAATALALVALRYGFMAFRTPYTAAEQAAQQMPPQTQR